MKNRTCNGSVYALPFIFLSITLLLSGCGNTAPKVTLLCMTPEETASPWAKTLELTNKYSDIPFAVDATNLQIQEDTEHNTQLRYRCTQSTMEKVVSLYQRDMLTNGWHLLARAQTPAPLFIFEKPRHLCVITITTNGKKSVEVSIHCCARVGSTTEK